MMSMLLSWFNALLFRGCYKDNNVNEIIWSNLGTIVLIYIGKKHKVKNVVIMEAKKY